MITQNFLFSPGFLFSLLTERKECKMSVMLTYLRNAPAADAKSTTFTRASAHPSPASEHGDLNSTIETTLTSPQSTMHSIIARH